MSSTPKDVTDPLAIALGNPAQSQVLTKYDPGEPDLRRTGVKTFGVLEELEQLDSDDEPIPERAETIFLYKAVQEQYDTGFYIAVQYSWNEEVKFCVENEALCCGGIGIDIFRHEILNKIRRLRRFTRIGIKTTKGGNIEVSDIRIKPLCKDNLNRYPPLPDSPSATPRIPISSLRKHPLMQIPSHKLDIVTLFDDLGPTKSWYVFKRYPIPNNDHNDSESMQPLLLEANILCCLNSPYIIKPAFIVTDDTDGLTSTLGFRGYLMPYLPAGSLACVFTGLRAEGPDLVNWREPMFLHPKHLKRFPFSDIRPLKPAKPQLPWHLKHTWAIEATKALITLHSNGIYCGDIKLDNIMLDREGHLQFIDVGPESAYTKGYLAPELHRVYEDFSLSGSDVPLTEERDLWAFGVVLWQIAEEECDVSVEITSKPLCWRARKIRESTPTWYRNLVRRCMNRDPGKRPSAMSILKVLEDNK